MTALLLSRGLPRLPGGLEAPVPASYNDLFVDATIRDHVGWVRYQRTARVPRGWAGEQILIRVEAATHAGVVYVDDVRVAHHVGGYTPFDADATDVVTAGGEFRLTIGVNNVLTNTTIPRGASRCAPTVRGHSSTSTTSTTTPASPARCG